MLLLLVMVVVVVELILVWCAGKCLVYTVMRRETNRCVVAWNLPACWLVGCAACMPLVIFFSTFQL